MTTFTLPTRRRRRLGFRMRWTLTCAAILIATVWGFSLWWYVGYLRADWDVGIQLGGITAFGLHSNSIDAGDPLHLARGPCVGRTMGRKIWLPEADFANTSMVTAGGRTAAAWRVDVPLWPLFLFTSLTAGFLWLRHHRAIPAGHCRRCRYDCVGIAEGTPCPECGNIGVTK